VRQHTTPGQDPDQVVAACVRQVRRAIARPETRVAIMRALKPYNRGTGHSDLNGDGLPQAILELCKSITFYREPAGATASGAPYPGEVVQSPTLTIEVRGGDCDDVAVLAATAGAVMGCEAAIGCYPTSSDGTMAHIVAAIRPGWYAPSDAWVIIDPQNQTPTGAPVEGARWSRV
jgi:hypothetical protein